MPQLDISTFASQIFWLLMSFTFLCVVVGGYLAPTIGRHIRHRETTLETLEAEVAQLQQEIQALTEQHQARHQDAKREALHIVSQAEQELQAAQAKQLEETFEVLAHQTQQALQRMDQNKEQVLQETTGAIAQMTSELLRKLTGLMIHDAEIQKLILKKENT